MYSFKHHEVEQYPSADEYVHLQERTIQQGQLYEDIAESYSALRSVILSVLGSRKTLSAEIDGLGEVTLNHVSEKAVNAVIRRMNARQVIQATSISDDELHLTHVFTLDKTNPQEKTITDCF